MNPHDEPVKVTLTISPVLLRYVDPTLEATIRTMLGTTALNQARDLLKQRTVNPDGKQ